VLRLPLRPQTKRILQLLRLRQKFNGTFVKLNQATICMLRWVEPYVMYGYPSLSSVKQLVYKRGFAKLNKQRLPITDNSLISDAIGESTGINCVEDLIHEIYTCGPNFRAASRFLWTFKLSAPTGGFKDSRRHFNDGGDCGAQGVFINQMIAKMI
jgi:large subunit ribosomal protein L7e